MLLPGGSQVNCERNRAPPSGSLLIRRSPYSISIYLYDGLLLLLPVNNVAGGQSTETAACPIYIPSFLALFIDIAYTLTSSILVPQTLQTTMMINMDNVKGGAPVQQTNSIPVSQIPLFDTRQIIFRLTVKRPNTGFFLLPILLLLYRKWKECSREKLTCYFNRNSYQR